MVDPLVQTGRFKSKRDRNSAMYLSGECGLCIAMFNTPIGIARDLCISCANMLSTYSNDAPFVNTAPTHEPSRRQERGKNVHEKSKDRLNSVALAHAGYAFGP